MATSFDRARAEFGEELRRLRESTTLNGKEFANRLGWNAPKVSKLETGKQTASQDDLNAWLAACSVSEETAAHLTVRLSALNEQYVTWKAKVRAGHASRQQESVEREAAARLIRAVDVGVVPGLLQTPEYARHVLLAHANIHGGGQDITAAIRARMRRQEILYEPGRTIELLMTESALLHPVAPQEVMAGQVHRLMAAIGTPNVRVGILPVRVRLPYMLMHGYWIVDDVVMIETVTGELSMIDPDEVATYNKVTDMLWAAAAESDAARELLVRQLPAAGS
ncbi:helix-turn-helix domain-containing protein [Actinocrispum wychmicini]|uniref:Helix-turn-helix protein n=1 Tax=Actinocrispum wychmicini TaxID=1213861 RepID=A0A4R2K573_9PSEU|nr:helix-turn-helix transcriptional regulator [Actinocrispum wychmicini]TCO64969.1 helix-turn-helix protein [Actinocrispum wychmicini]